MRHATGVKGCADLSWRSRVQSRWVRELKLRVADSQIEGRGLFATVVIRAGEVLFDDDPSHDADDSHVVMTDEEFAAFIKTVDKYNAVALGDGLHRVNLNLDDPSTCGNHSCDPNAWLADDHITLVARRDISVGEEVTTDYAMWSDTSAWRMDCNCGAARCRGVLTGDDWRRQDLQDAYRGHWPEFLERRIAEQRS